jgi:hypothetical protein
LWATWPLNAALCTVEFHDSMYSMYLNKKGSSSACVV